MRMCRGEHQWCNVRKVQPQRELAADHATSFAVAAASDHLNAAQPIGVSRTQERYQCVEGALGGVTVQVERPRRGQFAGAKTRPCGAIHTWRMHADGDCWQSRAHRWRRPRGARGRDGRSR